MTKDQPTKNRTLWAEDVKEAAEYFYIVSKMPLNVISENLGIPLPTLNDWRRKRQWDEKLKLGRINPHLLAYEALGAIKQILDNAKEDGRPPSAPEADSMNKLYKMVDGLSNSARFVANGTELMKLLMEYIEKNKPEMMEDMRSVASDFIHELYRKYQNDVLSH
jgi:hypothetical protein